MIPLRWSQRALRDLKGISNYLQAEDSFHGSLQLEHIWDAVQQLSRFPLSGPVFKRSFNGRVLTVTRTPYLIYYRVREEMIMIVMIRHGAQEQPKHFPR